MLKNSCHKSGYNVKEIDAAVSYPTKSPYIGWNSKNNFIFVFFISGFFGFLLGVLFATVQDVVAPAQVISGVVRFPYPTVGSRLLCQSWGILNQICALFLLLGISEIVLCYLVTGFLVMLSFQGLSLITLALSNNCLLSITAPFLILLTSAHRFGINYPIFFFFSATYGVLGRAFALLVIAVISNKRYRVGAFLLGIAPATHPLFGLLLWLAAGFSLLCDFKALRSLFSSTAKYFLLGCLVFTFSLSFHFLTSAPIPQVSQEVASHYLEVFVRLWDIHRQPVDFTSVGMYLNIITFGICLLWIRFFGQELSENIRFLLRSFMVFSASGIFFSALTWLPLEYIPNIIISLMPQRMVNLSILGFLTLLMGLFSYYRSNFGTQLVLIILVTILSLLILRLLPIYFLFVAMFGGSMALVILTLAAKLKINFSSENHRFTNVAGKTLIYLLIFLLSLSIIKICLTAFKPANYRIPNPKHVEFWNTVSKGEGMILVPMKLSERADVQIMTRRPVFLNTGYIGNIPYALSLGPELDRILKEIYGLEFINPPEITSRIDFHDHLVEFNKRVWEARTIEQWRNIRKKYGTTEIVTYSNWKLQLPVRACDHDFALYTIPLEQ